MLDKERRLEGIVTVDDIVEVVQEEASEDIQKLGGMEALDAPYMQISFWNMVKKRAGWLAILFVGEMLTATAMAMGEGRQRHHARRAPVSSPGGLKGTMLGAWCATPDCVKSVFRSRHCCRNTARINGLFRPWFNVSNRLLTSGRNTGVRRRVASKTRDRLMGCRRHSGCRAPNHRFPGSPVQCTVASRGSLGG